MMLYLKEEFKIKLSYFPLLTWKLGIFFPVNYYIIIIIILFWGGFYIIIF